MGPSAEIESGIAGAARIQTCRAVSCDQSAGKLILACGLAAVTVPAGHQHRAPGFGCFCQVEID
jgi:hypothetical protein